MRPENLTFDRVARLPDGDDNVAIATRRLEPGSTIEFGYDRWPIPHTVLEGHRFAVRPITKGEPLLSWGLTFGHALARIMPGEYVCNEAMLTALAMRDTALAKLPAQPNFADHLAPFRLDATTFRPAPPVEPVPQPGTFRGYRRPGRRGVGTRNFVVVIGTSSRTGSFARQLVTRLQPLARVHPGIDGIVAIAHTEGGGPAEPNNVHETLRALAGFMVHPNVAAVFAVDYGIEPVTNARLREFMVAHNYPLEDTPHRFLSLRQGLAAGLAEGEQIVRGWLGAADAARRTDEPLSGLRIALQCGGSDAFSGVSGNPLAGAVMHEAIRHGATGVLTETDEAVGAEAYLMKNVRDLATAQALLGKIESFRERLRWHGITPESNPSAGNRFRGLYNISLKSLGAVHKKDPRTRIDFVTDYAEPLGAPGFYFMNGPGNDLEGIAGQVAAGCNLILFVTGNGSITNFPFVPTLKVTTTSRRHDLLAQEMDINAGQYLEGLPMEYLVRENFKLLVETAAGRRTRGEHAGHSQVSLWRNWRQTGTSRLTALRARIAPDGTPLPVRRDLPAAPEVAGAEPLFLFQIGERRFATERVGLVLPTSLCSTQIARLAAERLNAGKLGRMQEISRFIAFTHTEGCGFGGESMYHLLHRTYRGYLTHPNVATALLLEHGCEKVPNDVMRHQLAVAGIPAERFGWASVQLDGGIERALARIEKWFVDRFAVQPPAYESVTGIGALTVGLLSTSAPAATTAETLATLAHAIVLAGGSVLVPESDPLLATGAFRGILVNAPRATLAYGQPLAVSGFHVIASETDHWVENLTGLGGCGAHLAVALVSEHSRQGHPLLPVIQLAEPAQRAVLPAAEVDLFLAGDAAADRAEIVRLIAAVAQQEMSPAASASGFVDFQLTRGELGVTT
jgi:altronate dehydratase